MRTVNRPVYGPTKCAITGRAAHQSQVWIDTNRKLQGLRPHVYVCGEGAEEIARTIGWVRPEDAAGDQKVIARLEARIAELEGEVAAADAALDGIDALESKGFRTRKKPGRPTKGKETP